MAGCDEVRQTQANHIVLFIQEHLYSIDVYGENQAPLPPAQVLGRMQSCVVDAQKRGPAPPVSLLTADNREAWAKVRIYTYFYVWNSRFPLDAPIFIGFITPESFDSGENRLVSLCTLTRLSYARVFFCV